MPFVDKSYIYAIYELESHFNLQCTPDNLLSFIIIVFEGSLPIVI